MNWLVKAYRLTTVSLFSAGLLLTSGCEDPNAIGVELPGTAPANTQYRDLPVTASTLLQDSLQTLKANSILVGNIRDNNLGINTIARGYFNLAITLPNLPFALSDSLPAKFTNPQLDSVVTYLSYNQLYGNTTQLAHFDLYNLQQRIGDREVYTSSTTLPLGEAIGTNLVSSLTRTRKTRVKVASGGATDTSTVVTQVADPSLRLVLHKPAQSSSFATALFEQLKNSNFNQAALDAFWKGLAVVPSAGFTGTMVGLGYNPSAVTSQVLVYYRVPSDPETPTKKKWRSYSIFLGTSLSAGNAGAARYFTQITPDLSGAGAFARLTDDSKEVSAAEANGVTYMQNGVGLGTKLVIPGLEDLRKESGLAINRAELIIPVKGYSNLLFTSPLQAYLYEINSHNRVLQRTVGITPIKRLVQADGENQQSQRAHSSNAPNSEATVTYYDLGANNKYYSVVITSYIQAYLYNQLGGELPAGLLLSPSLDLPTSIEASLSLNLNRAVLDGNNIKLRIYYSNLR
ncbi:DUF4270 family protein [Hymenobacter sp. BT491]|uniref:DUF4270 family protein n=1 Tax=Hymenobacter sp. BT491 TaxID=2766779 RepID=UPI0016538785|nr:DUF4270 family protein [Hymenobacter sp. BT491]MBC6991722.1 DUF4270 family protein [Hymenobacter sp. BT491]